MKNISYTNAGAGSGKTYKLTHLMADLITDKKAEPEQIILTTFSNDAAAELRERAKAVLIEKGEYEKAMRLDQAIIGTIHSMAQKFIQQYWYLLGISPELNVISENDTEFFINQSLAKLPDDNQIEFFNHVVDYFNICKKKNGSNGYIKNYNFWKEHLKTIIEKSRSYDITDFSNSRKESKEWIKQFVDPKATITLTDEEWEHVLKELEGRKFNSKTNQENINKLINRSQNRNLDWLIDFCSIINKLPDRDKNACPQTMDAYEEVAKVFATEDVYKRQERYIDIIFELADKWQKAYIEYKKAHQLIDFNDMEMYLIRLLNENPEVREEIGSCYRYLLVDEFQDSSLSQVKIFSTLSDFMEKTYFVGDEKQAIYSFRGGNPALIKAVTEYISSADDCQIEEPLDTSRRSTPEIVNVVNNVFCPLFGGHGMRREFVELIPFRETVYSDRTLRFWRYNGGRDERFYKSIGAKIKEMMDKEEIASYSEVAILGASNVELDTIANSLKSQGIPVNRGSGNIAEYDETELLFAVLSLLQNRNDTLSKIKIAYLTEEGWTLNKIIDDRLDYNEKARLAKEKDEEPAESALDKVQLVSQILAINSSVRRMSVASIVENVIIQLRLTDVVKRMNMPEQRIVNLYTLGRYAKEYEEHCVTMAQAATIDGFMDYIQLNEHDADGDPNGVNIKTYHSSKGLQWKVVILTSLNKSFAKDSDIIKKQIYGVQVQYADEPTKENFFPDCFITLKPWIMGNKSTLPAEYSNKIIPSDLFMRRKESIIQENTRLMYVGMTRARDMLVLVGQVGRGTERLKWFTELGAAGINSSSPNCLGPEDTFLMEDIVCPEEDVLIGEHEMLMTTYDSVYTEDLPRNVQPSADHSVMGAVQELGNSKINRIAGKTEAGNEAEVGNCIHQIYCDIDCKNPIEMAKEVIRQRCLTTQVIDPEALIESYRHLEVLLTENYGDARNKERELQFKHFVDGQIVNGSIDLVWHTDKGAVIVDYKTFQGDPKYVMDEGHPTVYAGRYHKQLNHYADALSKSGIKVIATLIYYPITGVLVKVD